MLSIVFWTASVSGTFSSSRILTPGSLAMTERALVVGLVVAVVVLRSDVDEADRQRLAPEPARRSPAGPSARRYPGVLQPMAPAMASAARTSLDRHAARRRR